jgi:hypothetical protein
MRRALRPLSLVALALVASAGCESDNPIAPDPITVNFSGSVAPGAFFGHVLTSDRRGIASATLNWGSTAVDLDFYATAAACPTTPFDCPVRVFSEQVGTTSERLVFGVANGENLKLWVFNFAGQAQNYTISVTLE